MSPFAFTLADAEAEQFCWKIVHDMMMDYGISEGEALRRINAFWKGETIGGKDEIYYHEDASYWADVIFNGGRE